ncbi:MAG: hypothetical protein IT583_02795, partial [Verrucomicrobia bacterium]|nr:hypothetical protein [Verrucomicrobiota bacterium]
KENYADGGIQDVTIPEAELFPIIGKLSSKDWKLCHTPRFQVALNGQLLEVEKGVVTNLSEHPLFGDFLVTMR